ncbi:MAG: ABC transporter permease [Muribaculaceae bacterium]|nr:ABC transporter permease [Muribaculaceae bacterium]
MVWKLLSTNISRRQIAAYTAANIIGMLIIGCALQLYRDVIPSDDTSSDPLGDIRYTVVSRPTTNAIFGGSPQGISDNDIDDIARQPWAETASAFIPAGFDVTVGLSFGGGGFSTALFFEGVPDEYLDVKPSGWDFDPLHPQVPIILPRDYLTLYNFGFAPTRGLPSIDEQTATLAPLKVTLNGNGISESLPGRIVGFSSRLNTIAVPEEFLLWANERFSPGVTPAPRRVIIKLADPGNPEISRYLSSRGFEESGNGDASRLSHFLRIGAAAVIGVGVLICLLSAGILILSVFLLLQKSRATISGLMNLGYSPRDLSGYYLRLLAAVNTAVLLLAGGATVAAACWWQHRLADLGIYAASVWPTIATMAAILAIQTSLSGWITWRIIRKIWQE